MDQARRGYGKAYLNRIASASIDISDGLAQDLQHLCINSKCGAFVPQMISITIHKP